MPWSIRRLSSRPQEMRRASFPFPVMCPANLQRWNVWLFTERRLWSRSICAALLLGIVSVSHAQPDAAPHPGAVVTGNRITGFIEAASRRFAIPASRIRAVMQAESGGEVRAVSPKGAMGLMQIMPDTWAELRSRYGLGTDPYDPQDNIIAGVAYLRELHDRFGERGFLGAYNAGPSRYEEHLATGRPLPSETLSYMATVSLVDVGKAGAANPAASSASSSLFIAPAKDSFASFQPSSSEPSRRRSANGIVPKSTAHTPLSDGLFARTSDVKARP